MSQLRLSDGTYLYYERIEGDMSRPCLVFLHEGLGCTSMWKDFPQKLCAQTGSPGLVYDRQGYGKSSTLNQKRNIHYLHEYALFELPAVISALIPRQSYILIGHSDGGSIGLITAAAQPPQLKAVITEAAHVFVEEITLEGIRLADQAYNEGKLQSLDKYHGSNTHQLFKAWSDTWLSAAFKHWSIEYLLPSINCPLLVIQGCDDQYGSERQVRTICAQSRSKAESVLVPNCAHSPHAEQRQSVLQYMSDFILSADL